MTDVVFSSSSPFRVAVEKDPDIRASLARLQRPDYSTESAISESMASDWPGDVAGRLLLTLSRMARSGLVPHQRIRELFDAMIAATAGVGHFGAPASEVIDEQQIACHGWVVSAYLQYGAVTGDPRALPAAGAVVDDLLLPGLSKINAYPRERRTLDIGAPSGTATQEVNGWLLSTDTWCVLLTLNGVVPLWEATRRADLEQLILALVSLAGEIDFVAERAQLHATVAAARNIARFAELSGSSEARDVAQSIYEAYVHEARTLNWAPFNWFGRPETWTEPCAIVDSIGLEFTLWRLNADPVHLQNLRRIELNAMAYAQRADGSFGLDAIATAEHPEIYSIADDAWWCCTMRGALGLVDLRDRSFEVAPDRIRVLLPRSGRLEHPSLPGWIIEFTAEDERLSCRVITAPSGAAPILIELPLTQTEVSLPSDAGASVTLRLPVEHSTLEVAPGKFMHFHADRIIDASGQRLTDGERSMNVAPRRLTSTLEEIQMTETAT
ncbi:hypothetical protein [Microbacterium sp.]|uniref:hypothetical protein n=1 Tax=Microbacterium sp. TaxID=51671 RepID=UPI003F7166DE